MPAPWRFPIGSLAIRGLSLAVLGGLFAPASLRADSCYPAFRDPAERLIAHIAQVCKGLQATEPSNCQRATGERCQQSYDEARRIRDRVCGNFAKDGAFLDSRQYAAGVDSQKAGQDANASLNQDNHTVSASLSAALQAEAAKANALIQGNQLIWMSPDCTKNTSYPAYAGLGKALNDDLGSLRDLLLSLSKQKKADAAQAQTVAAVSTQRSTGMTSLVPMMGEGGGGSSSSNLRPLAIGAGVGAGALGLYALSNMHDGGTSPPAPDLGAPVLLPGKMDETFNGDTSALFSGSGVQVDASFTDAHKRQIAQAINYFPACQRPFLRGLIIRNNPHLLWKHGPTAGKCLPGQNVGMSPPTIELNAACYGGAGVHTALVVHELLHVLANRRGYYLQYHSIFSRYPGCPVSPYSQTYENGRNINEDFAEAGRLALFPRSGLKIQASCVDSKIGVARHILNSCGSP